MDHLSAYAKLTYHRVMIARLQKWLLDCLIGLFIAVLALLAFIDNSSLVVILGIVAGVFLVASLVVGYGIFQGQQEFNNIMEHQRKS